MNRNIAFNVVALMLSVFFVGITSAERHRTIDLNENFPLTDVLATRNSIISGFNVLTELLVQANFMFHNLTDQDIQEARENVCGGLLANRTQPDDPVSEINGLISVNAVQELPSVAKDGDRFTDFINEEETLLRGMNEELFEIPLTQSSWQFALTLLVQSRQHISVLDREEIQDVFPDIIGSHFQYFPQALSFLCDERHSPARNESTATWSSWLWHGAELLGGSALVLVNLAANPEPITKGMSTFAGAVIASSGYQGLTNLMPQ